eukprot:1072302-Pleurochrysis_carterae.AAC.2
MAGRGEAGGGVRSDGNGSAVVVTAAGTCHGHERRDGARLQANAQYSWSMINGCKRRALRKATAMSSARSATKCDFVRKARVLLCSLKRVVLLDPCLRFDLPAHVSDYAAAWRFPSVSRHCVKALYLQA